MRAGLLRHKITIQRATETQSAAGALSTTWATFATVWSEIEPITGREFFAQKIIQGEITHKITIRYLSGVVPKMRIIYGSRTFDIEQVMNVRERNKEMALMCKEFM